ncbi:type II toxin-antitoxin system YafQ family toxin [uncultured Agrobacterium sp.]|uniref:type II toxin-antitoxin system YafQ family toxin n=1 Tax=uncultured Agrobacterium sp. TaxID=157277 RepID=UPI002590000D|nr:type II toxin-antitoxin system YafQ family toxin [uncultured Agrobacterium sp.]
MNESGRYDMVKLKEVMLLLIANDAPLPLNFRDHELTGDWRDHRECHIGGDFLLIYTLDDAQNLIVFTRAGTHSELFR